MIEVRPDDHGKVDEIVGKDCYVHLERMSDASWCLIVEDENERLLTFVNRHGKKVEVDVSERASSDRLKPPEGFTNIDEVVAEYERDPEMKNYLDAARVRILRLVIKRLEQKLLDHAEDWAMCGIAPSSDLARALTAHFEERKRDREDAVRFRAWCSLLSGDMKTMVFAAKLYHKLRDYVQHRPGCTESADAPCSCGLSEIEIEEVKPI